MGKSYKKYIHLCLYILFFIVIFLFIIYIEQNRVLDGDDFHALNLDFRILGSREDSCISNFLQHLILFYAPKIFHIHPNDFLWFSCFVYALLIYFICYTFARFISISNRKFFAELSCSILICSVFLIIIWNNELFIDNYYIVVRYVLPLLMTEIVLYTVCKGYLRNNQKLLDLTWQETFYCVILILLLNKMTEIFLTELALIFCLLLISCFIISKILRKIAFTPPRLGLNPLPVLILAVFTAGMLTLLCDTSIMTRVIKEINVEHFFELYKQYCISNIKYRLLSLLFLIIVSAVITFRKKDIKNIKYLSLSIIFIISNLTTMLSFIILDDADFLIRDSVSVIYRLFYLFSLCILTDQISSQISYKKLSQTILILIFSVISLKIILDNRLSINIQKEHQILYKERKISFYKNEKILRLYELKNKQPVIHDNFYYFSDTRECFERSSIQINGGFRNYYKYVYGRDLFQMGLCVDTEENTKKEFETLGGSFSEKELQDLKFQNLLDDNFILGKYD